MLTKKTTALLFSLLLAVVDAGSLRPGDVRPDGFLHRAYIVRFQDALSDDFRNNHTAWVRSLEHVDADGTLLQGIRHEFSLSFDGYSAVFDDETVARVRNTKGVAEVKEIGTSGPDVFHREGFLAPAPANLSDSSGNLRMAREEEGSALDSITATAGRGWNANRLTHRNFGPQTYADGPWLHDGYLGQGVTVYVLDTGLRFDQPGFQGSRVVHGANMVRNTQPMDKNGHGTMCAGVIAGARHGLSPRATVVSVKIANDQDRSACDDVVAGIQWVVKQPGPNNLKIISMSQFGFTGKPDVSTATAAAVRAGVHVVVCAGNWDQDACRFQPGNAPGVVSVGSVEPNGRMPTKQNSPEGTNKGKCLTIFAPGSRVPTLSATNLSPTYQYFAWGTSIAAPQVAALMANRLSKVGPKPPQEMVRWLQATATRNQVLGSLNGSPNLIAFSGVGEPDPQPGQGAEMSALLEAARQGGSKEVQKGPGLLNGYGLPPASPEAEAVALEENWEDAMAGLTETAPKAKEPAASPKEPATSPKEPAAPPKLPKWEPALEPGPEWEPAREPGREWERPQKAAKKTVGKGSGLRLDAKKPRSPR